MAEGIREALIVFEEGWGHGQTIEDYTVDLNRRPRTLNPRPIPRTKHPIKRPRTLPYTLYMQNQSPRTNLSKYTSSSLTNTEHLNAPAWDARLGLDKRLLDMATQLWWLAAALFDSANPLGWWLSTVAG